MKDREEFIRLRGEGLSLAAIAEKLGVCKQTLINWSKEHSREIENMRSCRMEALQEKHEALLEHQMELLSEQFDKVRKELSKRDYSEVPTDRLVAVLERLMKALGEQSKKIRFNDQSQIEWFGFSHRISVS